MAKYLLLKHYRSASQPALHSPASRWTSGRRTEISAHIQYMQDFGARRLECTGEFVDGQGLSPEGNCLSATTARGGRRSPTAPSRRPRT